MLDTALELRSLLGQLRAERALAVEEGVGENAAYMADLDEELVYRTRLYVTAAVVEIASLRAELDGTLVG
jgi:hypothetical protein